MGSTPPPRDEERAEEARHVAEDALEAAQKGDTEEARFLAGAARSLDRDAAAEVLADTEFGSKANTP